MQKNPKDEAARWRQTALATLATAKHLRERVDYRSCVSRAYYAAYQAATSVCLSHGDAQNFLHGWQNPTHDQLPDLINRNGSLDISVRRRVTHHLNDLRSARESADYRMGRTINLQSVIEALKRADAIFQLLEVEDADN